MCEVQVDDGVRRECGEGLDPASECGSRRHVERQNNPRTRETVLRFNTKVASINDRTGKMPAADDDKRKAARETIDILHEISTLLVSP